MTRASDRFSQSKSNEYFKNAGRVLSENGLDIFPGVLCLSRFVCLRQGDTCHTALCYRGGRWSSALWGDDGKPFDHKNDS